MTAPRTGSLGVADTTGDLYVVDANGHLERVPVGVDGQIIVADATALGPSGTVIGIKWADPTSTSKASFQVDATDSIFNKIDISPSVDIPLPSVKNRGTHSILAFDKTAVQGIAWQRFMPLIYTAGAALSLKIYYVGDGAGDGVKAVVWAAALERDNSGGPIDIDVDDFAALQTAAASVVPATSGVIAVASIAFTNAQADGILTGEPLRLFIQRTATAAGDTWDQDAQLLRAVLEEV